MRQTGEHRRKKRFHQPATAAKNLLHLIAPINPTKKVKRRAASGRNTRRKRPILTSRMRDCWNPPPLILPHSRKEDKTRQKSKENAITSSLRPLPSPLFIGSSLIQPQSNPPPCRRWWPRTNASLRLGRCPRCRLWGPLHHPTLPCKTGTPFGSLKYTGFFFLL